MSRWFFCKLEGILSEFEATASTVTKMYRRGGVDGTRRDFAKSTSRERAELSTIKSDKITRATTKQSEQKPCSHPPSCGYFLSFLLLHLHF